MTWDLIAENHWQMAIFLVCTFLAGIVRGCIGFGFSILVIASTSLFLNPSLLVPTVILLEVAASVHMLPSVWKDALWREMVWVVSGLLFGIPAGVYLLAVAPEPVLRLMASIIIFLLTLFVLKGSSFKGRLSAMAFVLIGVVSGFFSGVAAAGGIMAATCFTLTSLPIKQVRATLVVYLLLTGGIFIVSTLITSSLDARVINTVLFAIVPMALGIVLGTKLFRFMDEAKLRLLMLLCLSVLSVIGMLKAIVSFMS